MLYPSTKERGGGLLLAIHKENVKSLSLLVVRIWRSLRRGPGLVPSQGSFRPSPGST